jgi:hypothetical protein
MGLRRRGTPQTPGWQRNLNRNRCGLPVEAGERRGNPPADHQFIQKHRLARRLMDD